MNYQNVFNDWMQEHAIACSLSTSETYKKDSKNSLIYFNAMELSKITRSDIIKFINQEILSGYRPGTIRNHFKIVHFTFRWAVENGIIHENPCANIPLPPKVHKEVNPFSLEEVEKILSVDMPIWVRNAVEIAFRTGMRKGEIFALKWSDINFDGNFIMVLRTQSIVKNQLILKEPKTKCSRRRISIDNKLKALLENMLLSSSSEFVFSKNDGTPKIPWELSCKRLKSVCIKAGVSPRSFHNFRHTHASILLAAGVHPKIVQERLGHSSIKITLDTYSHLIPTLQQAAADVFNNI